MEFNGSEKRMENRQVLKEEKEIIVWSGLKHIARKGDSLDFIMFSYLGWTGGGIKEESELFKITDLEGNLLVEEIELKNDKWYIGDIHAKRLDLINGKWYIIKIDDKEELLMKKYELETGKNAITSRKTLRKDYIKWKENE